VSLLGYSYNSYCGAPPDVALLWTRWNLDPVLICGLLAILAAHIVALRAAPTRRPFFVVGWTIGALALVSPLCALSVSLFTARVGQHLILTMIAAPLIALGLPRFKPTRVPVDLIAATAFAAAMWFWHAPDPYLATFESVAVYWTMHVTTFGAALAFWVAIVSAPPSRMARTVAVAIATGLQMAFLGATIAFSPHELYAPHLLTTWAWGLTPLQDQQLGGAIMWAPAGLIFAGAILAPLYALLRRSPTAFAAATAG
jgi:putative membrane protein